jgi:hypothetical protein
VHVRWARGGEADVTSLDGDRIALSSTTASAPGSRPEGELSAGGAVRVKVARCRREGDRFLIEGRLLDATRDVRAAIARLCAGPGGG